MHFVTVTTLDRRGRRSLQLRKKYSIEILEFTVVSLGSAPTTTPTDEIKIVCSVNRRTYARALIFNFQLSIFNFLH